MMDRIGGDRFEHTIVQQYFGHTHQDEFMVYVDESQRPFSYAWIAPSLSTHSNKNAAYRVYDVDAVTYVSGGNVRVDVMYTGSSECIHSVCRHQQSQSCGKTRMEGVIRS